MKHFQIVIKGIATNKIDLIETTSFKEYAETLETLTKCKYTVLITTNIY